MFLQLIVKGYMFLHVKLTLLMEEKASGNLCGPLLTQKTGVLVMFPDTPNKFYTDYTLDYLAPILSLSVVQFVF